MSFQLSIITPLGEMLNEQIEAVIAPGALGQFEVMTGHVPIVYALKKGQVRVIKNSAEKSYQISEGVLEVNQQHQCLILAEHFSES